MNELPLLFAIISIIYIFLVRNKNILIKLIPAIILFLAEVIIMSIKIDAPWGDVFMLLYGLVVMVIFYIALAMAIFIKPQKKNIEN
jgi:hypothetical protein